MRRMGALAGAVALAACGLGGWLAAPVAGAADGPVVHVRLHDFKIRNQDPVTSSGDVTLHVRNAGPSTHEINVDRTSLADGDLPLGPDGLTVDEDAPQLHRIGSIEVLRLGETGDLTLHLPPGHYVLWCNLEGHYLGGMHASLDVKASR
jgi:uncharacterized cupredoxin-like copper-binding protein